jgi:hypothetical protein
MSHVDVFFLDVQGAELAVLHTLHWETLRLGVLVAECQGRGCTSPKDSALVSFVTSRCLAWLGVFRARHDVYDHIFVNRSLLEALPHSWDGRLALYDALSHKPGQRPELRLNRTELSARLGRGGCTL